MKKIYALLLFLTGVTTHTQTMDNKKVPLTVNPAYLKTYVKTGAQCGALIGSIVTGCICGFYGGIGFSQIVPIGNAGAVDASRTIHKAFLQGLVFGGLGSAIAGAAVGAAGGLIAGTVTGAGCYAGSECIALLVGKNYRFVGSVGGGTILGCLMGGGLKVSLLNSIATTFLSHRAISKLNKNDNTLKKEITA